MTQNSSSGGASGSSDFVDELEAIAAEILDLDLQDPELFEKFNLYTERFDAWREAPGARFQQDLATDAGRAMAEVHAQVLARAEEAKGVVAEQLKSLKKVGKGILAYTDVLPKRLSTIRPRKG